MSMDPQLEKALDKLRKGGSKIGEAQTLDGKLVIPVDGVLLTTEKVFAAAQISPKR